MPGIRVRETVKKVSHMRNVEPGFRVVSADGQEIGTIASCYREYCQVTTGILGLGHPLYVPMAAIGQTEGNTVYLTVASDRISQLDWSQPPAGASAESCAAGYAGTMPTQSQTRPGHGVRQAIEEAPAGVSGAARDPQPASPAASVSPLMPSTLESIPPGWPVICAEGKKLGTVAAGRPDGIVLRQGWFVFQRQRFVPATAIARVDEINHEVDLAATCADVNRFPSV